MQKGTVPLVPSQVRQAAAVLSRAFFDDPFFTFVLPDPDRRRRLLPWIFERTLSYGLRSGLILTTPALDGVALWLGPENTGFTWMGVLVSGLFLLPVKLSWRELKNSLRLNRSADRLHAQAVAGRHWYLVYLGVEPSLQGHGVGGILLRPVLDSADRQSLPCCLVTNNESNLRFYQRHGFALDGQLQPRPGDPSTWAMYREPG